MNGLKSAIRRVTPAVAALSLTAFPAMAFASEGGSLQVSSSDGVTFDAYRILDGDVRDGVLYGAELADGISVELLSSAGVTESDIKDKGVGTAVSEKIGSDGDMVARSLAGVISSAGVKPVTNFATGESVSLADGCYLIIPSVNADVAEPLLVLVGGGETVTVSTKVGVPSVTKVVGEVSNDGNVEWGKRADISAHAVAPYELRGTLPGNLESYKSYTYEFHDSMEEGLAVDMSTLKVSLTKGDERTKLPADAYEASFEKNELVVAFDNLLNVEGVTESDGIVVEYTASFTDKATIGAGDSNDNEVFVRHTTSLTDAGLTDSVHDEASVLTWAIDLTKLDGETMKVLAGAEFTVQDQNGKYVNSDGTISDEANDKSVYVTGDNGVVGVAKVDAGTYTITETKAPSGYALIKPFTVVVESDLATEQVGLSASVEGNGVALSKVDATGGTVTVSVMDPVKGSGATDDDDKTHVGLQTGLETYGPLALAAIVIGGGIVLVMSRRRTEK